MNIRNITVPKGVPMCSTGMLYSNVSLPCEPWETPTSPPMTTQTTKPTADTELLILEAIQSGNREFGTIMKTVFGPKTASYEDRARTLMLNMMKRGLLRRHREITLSGNPYIWEIAA